MESTHQRPEPARLRVETAAVREESLRWQAVRVAAQLPENVGDAHRVLVLADELVQQWVSTPDAK